MPKKRTRPGKRAKKVDGPRDLLQSGALCIAFANTAANRPDHRFRVSSPPLETAPGRSRCAASLMNRPG